MGRSWPGQLRRCERSRPARLPDRRIAVCQTAFWLVEPWVRTARALGALGRTVGRCLGIPFTSVQSGFSIARPPVDPEEAAGGPFVTPILPDSHHERPRRHAPPTAAPRPPSPPPLVGAPRRDHRRRTPLRIPTGAPQLPSPHQPHPPTAAITLLNPTHRPPPHHARRIGPPAPIRRCRSTPQVARARLRRLARRRRLRERAPA